jgi:IclR family acetate operon transcriptional repressor
VSVVARVVSILDALSESRRSLSLADLAVRTGLPRSSVHRVLQELEQHHYVMAASHLGGYRLGPEALKLALTSHQQLISAIRPTITALSALVNENVDLAVLSGGQVIVIEQITSKQRLQAVTVTGKSFPAHASGIGKVLLAQLPDHQVRALLNPPLEAFTEKTITNVDEYLAQLEVVRRTGIAYDDEEHDLGISAVATAVSTAAGVRQAVAIIAPTYRFKERSKVYVEALVRLHAGTDGSMRTQRVTGG